MDTGAHVAQPTHAEDVPRRALSTARLRLTGVCASYLGFGLFWAVSFTLSLTADATQGYTLASAITLAIAPLVCGLAVTRTGMRCTDAATCHARASLRPVLASLSGTLVLAGMLLAHAVSGVLGGMLVGLGSCGFFLLQQGVLVAIGPARAATVGAASATLSAVACVALIALPSGAPRAAAEVGLLVCATGLQAHAVRLAGTYTCKPSPNAWRKALRSLWRPSLCTTIFALVWKLSQAIAPVDSSTLTPLTLGAFGLAALLLCAQSLLARQHASLVRTYRALFPLVTGAFLLLPLLGNTYGPALSALLMFGFELVNLLLIFFCAQVAHDLRLPSSSVYALGVGPTLLAMLAGQLVGLALRDPLSAAGVVHLSGIALGAVYLLSLVLLLITRRSGPARGAVSELDDTADKEKLATSDAAAGGARTAAHADHASNDIESAGAGLPATVAALATAHGLTVREEAVALLIAQGRSVPVISDTLSISPNTVRGHAKHIYAKLGIHSKQDLIDMAATDGGNPRA